jgi:3-methyladenine DNA glycosylase AlkD
MSFIYELETAFKKNSNPKNAFAMTKYMRNQFSFFGIKTADRRIIFKEVLKENKKSFR